MNQILELNANLNATNDSQAGGSFFPTAYAPASLIGSRLFLTHAEAAALSTTSIGTLYGGIYQYVKFVSAGVRGQIYSWDVVANTGITDFEVVLPSSLAIEGLLGGIGLCTVTAGNYGWLQVDGLAGVKYRATVTDKLAGNIVTQLTTTATADAIANSTGSWIGGGALGIKNIIGTAYELPTDGGVNLVMLRGLFQNYGQQW